MKKIPAALALSASALVFSFGWYVLQTTGSSKPIEIPASAPLSSSQPLSVTLRGSSGQGESRVQYVSREREEQARPTPASSIPSQYTHRIAAPLLVQRPDSPHIQPLSPQVPDQVGVPTAYLENASEGLPSPPHNPPAVFVQGFAGSAQLNVKLAPGARLPVALAEDDEDTSPSVRAAKDEVAKGFEDEILQAAAKGPIEIGKTWAQAQDRADRRFRQLYGKDAYNRANLRAGQASPPAGQMR